jgi:hypothetical protein
VHSGRAMNPSEPRSALARLNRTIFRLEAHAVEHADRIERLLADAPPCHAVRAIAHHALAMRARFEHVARAHELFAPPLRLAARLAVLRSLVAGHAVDPERAFRMALVDLRHGVELVQLAREIARQEGVFGIFRWCDDWLAVRRTLVASASAQLAWFATRADAPGLAIAPSASGTALASSSGKHEQDAEPADQHHGWHPSRTS